jgi:hypothetical protein
MAREYEDHREKETQRGGKTESEPLNQPDRSFNPNRQEERERGSEDDAHDNGGQGQASLSH